MGRPHDLFASPRCSTSLGWHLAGTKQATARLAMTRAEMGRKHAAEEAGHVPVILQRNPIHSLKKDESGRRRCAVALTAQPLYCGLHS